MLLTVCTSGRRQERHISSCTSTTSCRLWCDKTGRIRRIVCLHRKIKQELLLVCSICVEERDAPVYRVAVYHRMEAVEAELLLISLHAIDNCVAPRRVPAVVVLKSEDSIDACDVLNPGQP